jgi:NAD(P) transhydrogenase subunit alpha
MTKIPYLYRFRLAGACLGLAIACLILNGCGSSGQTPAKPVDAAASQPPVTQPPVSRPPDPVPAATDNVPSLPPAGASANPADNRVADTGPPVDVIPPTTPGAKENTVHAESQDYSSLLFVFMLATFIGLGVILRVSRLLHTPLMSLTNAISAIAVVGSIIVTGSERYSPFVRFLGGIALFASMTNIVSGFLITDRMLKMFKSPGSGGKH